MVGGSNGGHNTKMMVEDYPGEYDGGLAGYGITGAQFVELPGADHWPFVRDSTALIAEVHRSSSASPRCRGGRAGACRNRRASLR